MIEFLKEIAGTTIAVFIVATCIGLISRIVHQNILSTQIDFTTSRKLLIAKVFSFPNNSMGYLWVA